MIYATTIKLHLLLRKKPILIISVTIILALFTSYFVINHLLHQELNQLQQEITLASNELVRNKDQANITGTTDLREALYKELGYLSHLDEPLTLVFGLAKELGVSIGQSQFRYSPIASTTMVAYEITIPAKGTYPAIRSFCERVLLAIPFASISELHLRRDNAQQAQIEGKLRLTLYLQTQTVAASKLLD